jgi:hypothetical protein
MTWQYQYTPYILPLFATAIFLGFLGVYGWWCRSVPGAIPFVALVVTAILTALISAAKLLSTDAGSKIVWAKLRNISLLMNATTAFIFALEYAGLGNWQIRRNLYSCY